MEGETLVVIHGLTEAEAKAFIEWYDGQGEQDAAVWMECRMQEGEINRDFFPCDIRKTYPIKVKDGAVHMFIEEKKECETEKEIVSTKPTSKYLYDTLCNLIVHEGIEIPTFVRIPFEDHCQPPIIKGKFLDDLYLIVDDVNRISANNRDYYSIRKYSTDDIIGYLREDAIEDEVYIIYEEIEKGIFGVPRDKFLNQAVFMTHDEADEELKEMLKDW